jgi:hypothetical protein
MDIQTATTMIVTIQLTAEEANSELLDPTQLQAALARALNPDLYTSRRNGHSRATSLRETHCKTCGRLFDAGCRPVAGTCSVCVGDHV